jgi:hypothetical protein
MVRETEAEAVAYAVSEAIGLDANTAAIDYIQLYKGDKDTLMESLDFCSPSCNAFYPSKNSATQMNSYR